MSRPEGTVPTLLTIVLLLSVIVVFLLIMLSELRTQCPLWVLLSCLQACFIVLLLSQSVIIHGLITQVPYSAVTLVHVIGKKGEAI